MKTYLKQLEQLERLPENHFCFDLLPASPKSPFPLEDLDSVLSLFTFAIIESSFAVLCHLLIVV